MNQSIDRIRPRQAPTRREALGVLGAGAIMLGWISGRARRWRKATKRC